MCCLLFNSYLNYSLEQKLHLFSSKIILVSQVEKKDKKVSRVAPEYNDIFRRMFEVLSDSIDRHHPDIPKTRAPKSNDPIVYETSSRE